MSPSILHSIEPSSRSFHDRTGEGSSKEFNYCCVSSLSRILTFQSPHTHCNSAEASSGDVVSISLGGYKLDGRVENMVERIWRRLWQHSLQRHAFSGAEIITKGYSQRLDVKLFVTHVSQDGTYITGLFLNTSSHVSKVFELFQIQNQIDIDKFLVKKHL